MQYALLTYDVALVYVSKLKRRKKWKNEANATVIDTCNNWSILLIRGYRLVVV